MGPKGKRKDTEERRKEPVRRKAPRIEREDKRKDPEDIIVLTKAFMASNELRQPPELVMPKHIADTLPPLPTGPSCLNLN